LSTPKDTEKLKVDGDFENSGKNRPKREVFSRKTDSGKRNLEGFPLYNYLRVKDRKKSNTYPIMDETVP